MTTCHRCCAGAALYPDDLCIDCGEIAGDLADIARGNDLPTLGNTEPAAGHECSGLARCLQCELVTRCLVEQSGPFAPRVPVPHIWYYRVAALVALAVCVWRWMT